MISYLMLHIVRRGREQLTQISKQQPFLESQRQAQPSPKVVVSSSKSVQPRPWLPHYVASDAWAGLVLTLCKVTNA